MFNNNESSTYTYILWDKITKDAIIIDPVDIQCERDYNIIISNELQLNLLYGINTHAHADHITGTYILKQKIPTMKSIISKKSNALADIYIENNDIITFGKHSIKVLETPGHTAGCCSYITNDNKYVFTGDTLLINGCGRTDFQGGSAEQLYDSIYNQLFTLPNTTIIYPGHDYNNCTSSTIENEKLNNSRLNNTISKNDFVTIMNNLNLAYPKKIDIAVPANMRCGAPDLIKE